MPRMRAPMHSSPTAHGAAHTPHASGTVGSGQHIAMGSAARPESLWDGGGWGRPWVGGEDPSPPELTSGIEQRTSFSPRDPPSVMYPVSVTGVSPCFSWEQGGESWTVASHPPTPPPPSPNQVAQKQIIQLLRMQPRHLSQPEYLIFYRLKCMQIGPSPREHP